MLCMFQKCCTFAPSKQKDDNRSLILGYGVMVTQQILVLFFLVRVRVAQLHLQRSRGEDKALLGYGVMVTQQILVLFFLVRVRVAQQKGVLSNQNTFFVSSISYSSWRVFLILIC